MTDKSTDTAGPRLSPSGTHNALINVVSAILPLPYLISSIIRKAGYDDLKEEADDAIKRLGEAIEALKKVIDQELTND